MHFPNCNLYLVSIIFNCCLFISSATSLHIVNCRTNWVTTILSRDPQDTLKYHGNIDAELAWNKTYGVALVKKVRFSGITQYHMDPMKKLVIDVSSLRSVRVQRLVEYDRKDFKDIAKDQCSLGFIYDHSISLNLPVALENEIISLTEACIEDQLCKFDPESHRIGDDIHIKSKFRKQKNQITSQVPINAAVDFAIDKLTNDLVKANKSFLEIPKFNFSVFPVEFSSLGGPVDILKNIKRADDLSFQHEGRKYIIESLLSLTGGHIQLHNVSVSSPLGNFVDGKLPVNMTGATFRMKVAFDYNQTPCKISVLGTKLNISSDQVDFSSLKIFVWTYELTNVETILKTLLLKSLTVSAIADQVAGLVQDLVEELKCENYRDMLFKF